MYATNLTKGQAFPLAIRVCSKPRSFKGFHSSKPQSLQIGAHPKPSLILSSPLVDFATDSSYRVVGNGIVAKPRSNMSGFRVRSATQNWLLVRGRGFSNWSSQKGNGESNSVGRSGNRLPWLAAKEAKRLEQRATATKTPLSSWRESAKRLEKDSNAGSSGEEAMNLARSRGGDRLSKSSWDKSAKRVEEERKPKTERSSWEVSAEGFVGNGGPSEKRSAERRTGMVKDRPSEYSVRDRRQEEANSEGSGEEEEMDVGDDPRWDQIKNKFRRMEDVKSEKPEYRRWDRQENWGRKTWQEASESSVPRLVGQGVYGVGPVLAALSAGRREFYTLYVQEGLDLSNNNRKKKDKKGFERVLRMAENFGVNIKELRKHDLNMAADNRPHQGLLLDASPLEMVKIKELDPVSVEEDKGSLWIALDEVTDPQNLGAIIRSSYFFGAAGVVLCAKNSAPLSGVVSKASAGSLELMELRYCKNMMQFLTSSAENGWRVLGGSVSSKAIPLNEIVPSEPTILVLGSEGTGLRPLVERSCTQLIRIPGNIPADVTGGGFDDSEPVEVNHGYSAEEFRSFLAVESLNVSVAAGVLLHHLVGNNEKSEVHEVAQQNNGLD
ncbi:putative tRNA/rRNA methyltransferase slr0955 [Rosa sericea]